MKPNRGLAVVVVTSGMAVYCVQAFVTPGIGWRPAVHLQQRHNQRHCLPPRDTCFAPNKHCHTPLADSVYPVRPISLRAGATNEFNGKKEDEIEPVVASMLLAGEGRQKRAEDTESGRGERRWAALRRSFKRGAASLAALTFGATTLSGMSAELKNRVGISVPTAVATARASVFKPFSKRTVEEKLGNLPAFMVTNYKGSPYLAPSEEEGLQMAVFFTSLDDAQGMLQEMVQNPYYTKNARVLVLSMERAYGMVKGGPKGTGYVNSDGREDYMYFKFERDGSSINKALRLGLKLEPSAMDTDIPVFYAEGLEIKKEGSLVRPLFMDPSDLVTAWKKASEENAEMPKQPTVKVFSFADVIIQMETSDDLKDFGFFPSSEAKDFISKGRAMKALTKARLGKLQAF